ncbi:uncharacterized protein LOC115634401 [Scaptodrosophila lebanonensis]|uniref:Uncharacterized protein LOC115634401 n=1 Tax=Drosophila lebanonensis TaxID=7225 RepID=A0A6J2UI51_DROLE|nr:uncharacterized protein LOC115634401 [Scaptodrosophila lebanonensis]
MFEPETEDMLPRAAPKPSTPSEAMAKPTVPEVSILFGQMPPQQQQEQSHSQQSQAMQFHQQQQQQQRTTPTFASWKKQMLPRVNFSPVLTTELGPATSSTSTTITTQSNEYVIIPRSRASISDAVTTPMLQSSSSNVGYVEPLAHYQREQLSTVQHRRSLDSAAANTGKSSASDVLTICAGTQTDAVNISPKSATLASATHTNSSHLASKQDVEELINILECMRQEQQLLRQLCESLIQQQRPSALTAYKETGTQCDILANSNNNVAVKRLTPIIQEYIIEEDEFPAVPFNPTTRPALQAQFQTPRVVKPMAQSTGYRPNTPQGKVPPPVVVNVLPKPNTEKSLVMNELALKYLPQQQLDELMQELRLASPGTHNNNMHLPIKTASPLRQIDNLAQSPNDISNASYKYLKKYRLLPEEKLNYTPEEHLQTPPAVRRPQQVQQRVGSPLIGTASPLQLEEQPMLDLENIRNQPKLL